MTEVSEFSAAITNLLQDLNETQKQPIKITIDDVTSGKLRYDEATQVVNKNGQLTIRVTDQTNVDFSLSHELLHLTLLANGFPQLSFGLTTGDGDIDTVLTSLSTALYNAAAHLLITSDQRAAGLIDETVETQFMEGFYETTPLEKDGNTDLLFFRILNVLDALVFFTASKKKISDELANNYPTAYPIAEKLYQEIIAKSVDTPFAFRRLVVHLFSEMNQIMLDHGIQAGILTQFAGLSPVLSERQLRLSINQNFEIKHAELRHTESLQGDTFLVNGKADHQLAFVLVTPKKVDPEYFQSLYQTQTKEFLQSQGVPFSVRA